MSATHRTAAVLVAMLLGPATPLGAARVAYADEIARASFPPLTAVLVGRRAVRTSFDVEGGKAELLAATARVEASRTTFLPRLTATARYVRESDFTPPSLGGQLVGTTASPGTLNPTPTQSVDVSFAPIVNTYYLEGAVTVPLTDYPLRIGPAHEATQHVEAAKMHGLRAAEARVFADAEVTYYSWVHAVAAVSVAEEALHDQERHREDAVHQFESGYASRADVLRTDTGVASARFALTRATSVARLTETQLRTMLHVASDVRLTIAETLDEEVVPAAANCEAAGAEALGAREEIKSLTASLAAARRQTSVVEAGFWPSLAAFGHVMEANPNPRVIPLTDRWIATWDAGVQLTWSPNDSPLTAAQRREAEANESAILARVGLIRDAIRVEIGDACEALTEAAASLEPARAELASADEARTVARALFKSGSGTSTSLTDAESELTHARNALLNARTDERIARVRLDHATGRDLVYVAGGP